MRVEIDGKTFSANDGDSIIEVADRNGIYIPRYCYHKYLSVSANCRMCLVEVEKSKKPLPACATPVSDGMKVMTQSPFALQAQRDVMSFLLINHPLDCPVCDQGGECELQDFAMGYGRSESDYEGNKRSVKGPELGPLIQTFMTRCIQCTRCVRYGEEVAGIRELGVINRSEHEAISVAVENVMQSEVSANIIDLCPVGALTSKPTRFAGRSWSYFEHESVAPHDCLGSAVYVHTLRNDDAKQQRVMRLVPRENNSVNDCWLSDADRFGFMGLNHTDRALAPRIKVAGNWKTVSWERLFVELADRLKSMQQSGSMGEMGALISPRATMEEQYLFQKLCRTLGTPHIDSRLRTQDFSDQGSQPLMPTVGCSLTDLVDADACIIIGGDIRTEQAVLVCRLNANYLESEQSCFLINAYDSKPSYPVAGQSIVPRHEMVDAISALLSAVKQPNQSGDGGSVDYPAWAAELIKAKKVCVILGEQVETMPNASALRRVTRELADVLGASFGEFTSGPNAAGAWKTGCLPHRHLGGEASMLQGDHVADMITSKKKAVYCLFDIDPEHDFAHSAAANEALKKAQMVIAMTSFATPAIEAQADFILPIAAFAETPGTYCNVEGVEQSFKAATLPAGDARPGWKVLRVLADFCELSGFEYRSVEEVRAAMKKELNAAPECSPQASSDVASPTVSAPGLTWVAPTAYGFSDPLQRHSQALIDNARSGLDEALMNQETLDKYALESGDRITVKQGSQSLEVVARLSDAVAADVLFLPTGQPLTAGFGCVESEVMVEKISE